MEGPASLGGGLAWRVAPAAQGGPGAATRVMSGNGPSRPGGNLGFRG